jgi:predicted short-subunit dehydrogenase-like oxidoreductase (DUF2520 family)
MRAGHDVVAASAISEGARRRAAQRLPGARLVPPDQVGADADLVLVAVPDDALAPLVAGLANAGAWSPGQLVAHTSGAHGIAPLAPATAARALPLALHPVMTFTGRSEDTARLAGITYGVTTLEELRPIAHALILELHGEVAWIAEEQRPLYHAALAHGANHLMTLVAEASELLEAAGVTRPSAMLGPLLGAALDNALRLGDTALTGPVVRGDAATVAAHLETLARSAPEAVPAYLALARRTADRALATGALAPENAEALLEALARRETRA